jgi:hypothetical protein
MSADLQVIGTPLMQVTKDFMHKLEEAQLALEGLASRYSDDYRFYRAILAYHDALIEYDPLSIIDTLEILGYGETECTYLYREVEPAFLKLVLAYQEFKDRKRLKG